MIRWILVVLAGMTVGVTANAGAMSIAGAGSQKTVEQLDQVCKQSSSNYTAPRYKRCSKSHKAAEGFNPSSDQLKGVDRYADKCFKGPIAKELGAVNIGWKIAGLWAESVNQFCSSSVPWEELKDVPVQRVTYSSCHPSLSAEVCKQKTRSTVEVSMESQCYFNFGAMGTTSDGPLYNPSPTRSLVQPYVDFDGERLEVVLMPHRVVKVRGAEALPVVSQERGRIYEIDAGSVSFVLTSNNRKLVRRVTKQVARLLYLDPQMSPGVYQKAHSLTPDELFKYSRGIRPAGSTCTNPVPLPVVVG